jgi:DNA polymerase-3 subunit beta
MKATLARAHLLRLLELAAGASQAESTAVLPLFAHVRLGAADGHLTAHTMMPEVAQRASAPATIEAAGSVAVPLRRTLDAIKTLGGEMVTVAIDGLRTSFAGIDGSVRLPMLADAEDRDQLLQPWALPRDDATLVSAMVPGDALRTAIRRVTHAMSANESRPQLAGVRLLLDASGAHVVATDGARIALADAGGAAMAHGGVTLPRRALDALLVGLDGHSESLAIEFDQHACYVETEGWAVRMAAVVAAGYPNFAEALERLTVVAMAPQVPDGFETLLRRCVAIGGRMPLSTTVTLAPGRVVIAAEHAEHGAAEGTLGASPGHGEASVPVNARYALEALEAVDGTDGRLGVLASGATPYALEITTTGYRAVVVKMAT